MKGFGEEVLGTDLELRILSASLELGFIVSDFLSPVIKDVLYTFMCVEKNMKMHIRNY